jgi:ATP phosphoribosyltransferase regulatory subunit
MAAESALRFEALEAQASALTDLFKEAGYERVAPSILQPASLFLDRMGEAIRARTYVFTDNDGEELCLRPDLTLPVGRIYVSRHPEAQEEARYCYNGPAFRYQPGGAQAVGPREFRQAGVEYIGGSELVRAETEVLSLVLNAVSGAGLTGYRVRVGDLGLFAALIEALDIPERWRLRLHHFFWRPPSFHDLLQRLSGGGEAMLGKSEARLVGKLDPDDPEAALDVVAKYLKRKKVPLTGARRLEEITGRLLDHARDAREAPLSKKTAKLIEDYLAVSGPPRAALARIDDLVSAAKLDISEALETARDRLDSFTAAGIELGEMEFCAEFGRDLEYYTGFVFQIELPDMGRAGHIAGGGRYDTLLEGLGAPQSVPAVGSAIHTERLLAAVKGGADE